MVLGKYSFGIGDRFGHQGRAQLEAMIKAKDFGCEIVPVWNKSHREHKIIGTCPADVRKEASAAVTTCNWQGSYYVDADHINLANVDLFVKSSDFFTIDVADFISKKPVPKELAEFIESNKKFTGLLEISGIEGRVEISEENIEQIGLKFLSAAKEAGRIYRHIRQSRDADDFITEVSMDESDKPQRPVELLFILSALSREGVPVQTIAPKFTGRFNKGVDYIGCIEQFEKEFNEDIAVINFAVQEFALPSNLTLSIHSGSDKFSIYKVINRAIERFDAGLHLKTAGTTWLEEIIGLAEAGKEGLKIAKEIYEKSLSRFDELCGPYSTVIDIDMDNLPDIEEVEAWSGEEFANVLRHDQLCSGYNPNFRQLLHVGYKIAAEMGVCYTDALHQYSDSITVNVTQNIFDRHIKPLFDVGY
jgi:hypothetical protein